jgi:hypothetical protein
MSQTEFEYRHTFQDSQVIGRSEEELLARVYSAAERVAVRNQMSIDATSPIRSIRMHDWMAATVEYRLTYTAYH